MCLVSDFSCCGIFLKFRTKMCLFDASVGGK